LEFPLEETPLSHHSFKATHAREVKGDGLIWESTDEMLVEIFSKDTPLADAFKCLFENASDAIYILDRNGNFVTVNRRAEELTGFRREDFVGKSFRKIIPFKSLHKAIRGFLDVIRGKEIRLELELKTIKEQLRRQQVEKKYSQEKVTEFIETRVKELGEKKTATYKNPR